MPVGLIKFLMCNYTHPHVILELFEKDLSHEVKPTFPPPILQLIHIYKEIRKYELQKERARGSVGFFFCLRSKKYEEDMGEMNVDYLVSVLAVIKKKITVSFMSKSGGKRTWMQFIFVLFKEHIVKQHFTICLELKLQFILR